MNVLNEELGGSIEEGMEIVMEQVFGRVILCDSLNIAKETAKECRLNANFQGTFVSLQGHVVLQYYFFFLNGHSFNAFLVL